MRDPRAYLWDVLQACEAIEAFIGGADEAAYLADLKLRSAVERQLIVTGEALSQLARVAPEVAARVPDHPQVIAFRNVLVHGYASLRDDEVWRALQQSLPALREAVRSVLESLDDGATRAP